MKEVKVYSTPTCHYCHLAKDFFKANNVPFVDYDVASDIEKRKEMIALSGQMGVPVIVVGDEFTIGFNKRDLAKMVGLV